MTEELQNMAGVMVSFMVESVSVLLHGSISLPTHV
jgi:hypothetical protein